MTAKPQPADLLALATKLRNLAGVIRKYGTCAPMALEKFADELQAAIESIAAQRNTKAQAFKDYVHQRLDAMGVPHSVPESEHDKAGCRIGGRLDFVETRIAPGGDEIYQWRMVDAGHNWFDGTREAYDALAGDEAYERRIVYAAPASEAKGQGVLRSFVEWLDCECGRCKVLAAANSNPAKFDQKGSDTTGQETWSSVRAGFNSQGQPMYANVPKKLMTPAMVRGVFDAMVEYLPNRMLDMAAGVCDDYAAMSAELAKHTKPAASSVEWQPTPSDEMRRVEWPESGRPRCADCGMIYGSKYWADFGVPDDAWLKISPTGGSGGILCQNCMLVRAVDAGIECVGQFTSGPFADHAWTKPAEQEQAGELPEPQAEVSVAGYNDGLLRPALEDYFTADQMHAFYRKGYDAALLRRAARVEVTDAMVDAAWLAYTGRATLGEAFAKDASCMLPCERQAMRAALTAALEPKE